MVVFIDSVGNERANSYWEATIAPHQRINASVTSRRREEFIREKYERRLYYSPVPAQIAGGQQTQETLNAAQRLARRRAGASAPDQQQNQPQPQQQQPQPQRPAVPNLFAGMVIEVSAPPSDGGPSPRSESLPSVESVGLFSGMSVSGGSQRADTPSPRSETNDLLDLAILNKPVQVIAKPVDDIESLAEASLAAAVIDKQEKPEKRGPSRLDSLLKTAYDTPTYCGGLYSGMNQFGDFPSQTETEGFGGIDGPQPPFDNFCEESSFGAQLPPEGRYYENSGGLLQSGFMGLDMSSTPLSQNGFMGLDMSSTPVSGSQNGFMGLDMSVATPSSFGFLDNASFSEEEKPKKDTSNLFADLAPAEVARYSTPTPSNAFEFISVS